MGGNGRVSDTQVMTGAFAFSGGNWPINVRPPGDPDQFLKRQFGVFVPSLPTPTDVTATLNETPYDVAPWNTISASGFRNKLEGWLSGPQMHNRVHVWVGGSMLPMESPNDPVFFLHHCFVDKLWADWQAQHTGLGYVPVSGGPVGHNLNDAMDPWAGRGETVTPASVLDHHALGYAYDTEPECRKTLLQDKGTRKLEKLEKFETKEFKIEKIEIKELKERKLEKLEIKEFAWEKPPRLEGKTIRELPDDIIRQDLPSESLEERLARMERAMGDLSHFIGADLRPDLNLGALSGEQDLSESDMEALRKQQAQAKADSDIGKLHEH
jgi:Common central domain of tyrosinase